MGSCTSIFSSCVNKQEVKQMGGRYKAQNQLTPPKVMNTLEKWIFTFPKQQQEFMTTVEHWAIQGWTIRQGMTIEPLSDFWSVFCPLTQAVIIELPDTEANGYFLFAVTGFESYTEKAGGEVQWKVSNWS